MERKIYYSNTTSDMIGQARLKTPKKGAGSKVDRRVDPALAAPLKQPPSLLVGRAPRQRLDLAPIPAFSGAIGRIAALAHYPLKPPLLGHAPFCARIAACALSRARRNG